jgi:hypothetical protein
MLPNGPRDSFAKLTTDGLCFAYNSLPSIPMYIDPYKENYSDTVVDPGVDFWNGPVYECSTVEEIIAFYNQYNYFDPSPNPQWSWQEQWADAEGNAVVVGLDKDGNVTFTEMNESQYMISTNFNLAYPESCDGPCGDSTWRYNKASEMLQNIVEEESLTVDAIRDVLEAISVESTVHSLVFNPKTLDIYVYYRHDFSKVFEFNIEEELSTLSAGEVRLYNLKEMYEAIPEFPSLLILPLLMILTLLSVIISRRKRCARHKRNGSKQNSWVLRVIRSLNWLGRLLPVASR